MQLKKLTSKYIELEDRVLVSADSDEGVVNLWLTRRLLKPLVLHILDWIEQSSSTPEEQLVEKPGRNTNTHQRDSLPNASEEHKSAQLMAQSRQPVPQVSSKDAIQDALVHKVQLQPRGEVLRLLFTFNQAEAELLLREDHARIWMGVLYRLWLQASWEDIWPAWIKQAHTSSQQYPVSQVH